MGARRIVTGVDADGRSVIADDGPAEELIVEAGLRLRIDDIWGADGRVTMPSEGAKPPYERFYPPTHGFRVMVAHIPPNDDTPFDAERYYTERERVLVGYSEDAVVDADEPELHTTQTVDVGVVLEGEIVLRLDDGIEATIRRGDYVVQNGTRHSWRNDADVECVLLAFVLGANRA
jgi:hypothetical protein